MMSDLTIEPGQFIPAGYHHSADCDGGKVFKQTAQVLEGALWPPAVYRDVSIMTEWHWCRGCGRSTKKGTLNMKEVK